MERSMNFQDYVVNRLKAFTKRDIIFTSHALIRITQRQIEKKEIIENLLNPKRLEYAVKKQSRSRDEEKFVCYFAYTKKLCHMYVIVIKNNILIVTVVKLNKVWQMTTEKKLSARRFQ